MNIIVPPEYVPIVQRAADETGVPYNVLAAKLQQESGFRPDARGAAGEIGIAQILPRTAARPGYGLSPIALEALRDPEQAIPWGARYLAARARAAGVRDWSDPAQVARGLAAYNGAGPQAARYGRQVAQMAGYVVPPDVETQPVGDVPGQRLWSKAWADAQAPERSADDVATQQVLQLMRLMGTIR
jgi:soluble lytic murein transglycosylase-like protein